VDQTPNRKTENLKLRRIVSALLKWFATNARDLPWRRTRDPYAIWVSEIMLQQTQVKTVIPYWERWLRELPDIQSLAVASPEKIHKLWEGLGYYTRVRNLQKAARQIVAQHHSLFPQTYEAILDLPGIGPYTAGAIASIAFNQPRPILDGNVIRVLTRIFAIGENPRDPATNKKLWSLARQLVTIAAATQPATRNQQPACSHLNQSLMELGALVCTPAQPKCLPCPIRSHCEAFRLQRVGEFPNLGPRIATTNRHFVAFVIQHRNRFLVQQRPAGQVNAHLWEFPNLEIARPTPDLAQLARDHFGASLTRLTELRAIKHTITRYRITLQVCRATTIRRSSFNVQPSMFSSNPRWLTLAQLNELAFTSAHRKILAQLSTVPKNL